MNPIRAALAWCAGIAMAACAAAAQDHEQALYVESLGESTVMGVPTEVYFVLRRTDTGESLEAALGASHVFELNFKESLTSHALQPMAAVFEGPVVIDPSDPAVESTVVLRYGLASFSGPQQSPGAFGKLCDDVSALARAQGCIASSPQFDLGQSAKDALLREAVQGATENAYTGADSAAKALGTSILTINLVQVLEVVWNDPASGRGIMPSLRQFACTARVRVLYELQS